MSTLSLDTLDKARRELFLKLRRFSTSFLFGASTAAHQVEGGNFNNDWWEFEQKGKIRDGSSSRVACDHYHLFDSDFALAKSLGHTTHRLSLEWSRIEPSQGVFSKKETAHYRQVLQSLKKHRLTSFVTLQHFTIPLWFAKKGGWTNSESPQIFEKYVRFCAENFGDLVDFWLTVNEPQALVLNGYLTGVFPPEKRNPLLAFKVAQNLMQAHNLAYETIHRQIKSAKVSFTTVHNYFQPNFLMRFPDWFLNRAKNHLDFIGLDYYHHYRFTLPREWAVYPERTRRAFSWGGGILAELPQESGLLPLLRHLKKHSLPIYITENGTADTDRARVKLIKNILREVLKAINEGVDVRGYLHWTFMDNFEWYQGKSIRMGLCETDYHTLKRVPRPSARVFRRIIQTRQV